MPVSWIAEKVSNDALVSERFDLRHNSQIVRGMKALE